MNETMMAYEETIDLKDLCVYILRKWRVILLAIVVGAVVLGGYKAVSRPQVVTDNVRVQEILTLLNGNEAEITEQKAEQEKLITIRDTIEGLEKEIQIKEKKVQAQTISLESLSKVVAAYENSLKETQDLLKAELSQELKVELTSRISDLQMNILDNSNQMVVAEQCIETLKADIVALEEDLKECVEKYEMDLKTCQAEIDKLEDSIEKLTEENKKLTKEDTTITVSVSVTDVVKFVVLGAVAGGFVVCGVAFVQYFMDKKLRRVDELKERYGMRILGDFYAPVAKKNKLDQMLDRMDGFQAPVDAEKEAALAAAKVQVLAPVGSDTQQIIVTGTVEGNVLEMVAQKIGKNLPEAEYEIIVVQNPVYDAEALLAVRQGTVVLVEARGVSVKKEIEALVEILRDAQVKMLGVVLQ